MKILHLDFDDLKNPNGGGQAIRTFEINRRLAKKHQVTVITGNYQGAKDEIIDNIQYLRVGSKKFPWSNFSFIYQAIKRARSRHFDILVENFTPPFGPSFLPFFTKKPVVAMVDWAFAHEMSAKYKLPLSILQDFGTKFYQNFIFPTNAIAQELLGEQLDKKNVLITPNLMASDFKRPKNYSLKNYILFIGRLDIHQKGIDLLLKAFSRIVKAVDIKLYIAGEGKDKGKIIKLINKLNIGKKVELLGKISGDKKIKYFSQARLVCIPSRYEANSVVAAECVYLKKVVVAFNIPVLVEATQNQAVYAQEFNIDDLAQQITYAYKNAEKIQKELKFKPLPTWDKLAALQKKFYYQIIKKSKK